MVYRHQWLVGEMVERLSLGGEERRSWFEELSDDSGVYVDLCAAPMKRR